MISAFRPGSRGGSARVPVAEASPCVGRKADAVASASRRAERMRHVRAAERRCTVANCAKHRHIVCGTRPHPAKSVFRQTQSGPQAKSPAATVTSISKPTFRLAGGRGGGETPPAPITFGVRHSDRGCRRMSAVFCADPMRRREKSKIFAGKARRQIDKSTVAYYLFKCVVR